MIGKFLKPITSITSDKVQILIEVDPDTIDFDLIRERGVNVEVKKGVYDAELIDTPEMAILKEIRQDVKSLLPEPESVTSWEDEANGGIL